MRKSTKVSLVGFGIFLGLVGIGAIVLPRGFEARQSVVINAPPEEIHAMIAAFRNWGDWAGWNREADTDLELTFEGPESGTGASMSWQSPTLGAGRMVITRAEPRKGVWIEARIGAEQPNIDIAFLYEEDERGTRVVWITKGRAAPVIGGYLVPLMEEGWSNQMRQGLTNLKAALE